MRLHRLIAICSELSRRSAEEAIAAGRVSVNGRVVTRLGTSVSPGVDRVVLDDKLLTPPVEHVYLAFNKPSRCIVTKSDPQGRPTIWSYLTSWKGRLNAAGRLDHDAEGLLLLSDDGTFVHQVIHPRHEVWKVYEVKVKGVVRDETIHKLATGIDLPDGKTAPAKVQRRKGVATHTWLEIGIREGRNRQLKRMCDAVGHPVIKLKRTAIGSLKLGRLKRGTWRFLTPDELRRLQQELATPPRP